MLKRRRDAHGFIALEAIRENLAASLLARSPLSSSRPSPIQGEIDAWVGGFVHQATDWRSLAAMAAGGGAYRLGRIGILSSGSTLLPALPLRVASIGVGLTAEVSTFEMTHRGLSSVSVGAHGRAPLRNHLWSWNGSGGLRQGLLHSFITFGALKGAGRISRGENLIAQHLFQDSAMVLGHQVTGALGILPRPTGGLAEQFLHAEATLLQIGAGMSLAHGLSPRWVAMERGLDLSLFGSEGGARSSRQGEESSPLPVGRRLAFEGAATSSPESPRAEVFSMSDGGEGSGESRLPLPPPLEALRTRIGRSQEESTVILSEGVAQILKTLSRGSAKSFANESLARRLKQVEENQSAENQELLEFASLMSRLNEDKGSESHVPAILQAMEWRYSRLFRTREQLAFASLTLPYEISGRDLFEIRRRMEWVLSTPEFERSFDWQATPAAVPPYPLQRMERFEMGLSLLLGFHFYSSRDDVHLYTSVAQGPVRGREIAFDLDKTIAEVFIRPDAQMLMATMPHYYDVPFGHFVHQYHLMRVPYRGVQALLLGLWAAGNSLKIYTASDNVPLIHDAFLNDFPLLKVAFELTQPHQLYDRVTPAILHESPRFMDRLKRREFQDRYLETKEGRDLLRSIVKEQGLTTLPYLTESKIPLPGFDFEVLADDKEHYAANMEALGFGRRGIVASGEARLLYEGLRSYFLNPPPPTSEILRRWLEQEKKEAAPTNVVSLSSRTKTQASTAALVAVYNAFVEWSGNTDTVEINRQWRQLEFRLSRRPKGTTEALAQLIQRRPLAAKVFLVSAGLVPPDSFLASEHATYQARLDWAEDDILPDVFHRGAQHIGSRYHAEREGALASPISLSGQRGQEKLARLPTVIFQLLADPTLDRDLFLLLAEHWDLGKP